MLLLLTLPTSRRAVKGEGQSEVSGYLIPRTQTACFYLYIWNKLGTTRAANAPPLPLRCPRF